MKRTHMMQDKKKHILVVLFAIITVGACATKPAPVKTVDYQCDRGTSLSVTFTDRDFTKERADRNTAHQDKVKDFVANVTLADGTLITLPAQIVASGFMYSNGKYSLRGKGNEAMWSVGRMLAEQCLAKP